MGLPAQHFIQLNVKHSGESNINNDYYYVVIK